MATDVPPDVGAVLSQLFAEAAEAFEMGDAETGASAIESASSVVTHKLQPGLLREQLRHGCDRIETIADGADCDQALAAAYVSAMERRLAASTGSE